MTCSKHPGSYNPGCPGCNADAFQAQARKSVPCPAHGGDGTGGFCVVCARLGNAPLDTRTGAERLKPDSALDTQIGGDHYMSRAIQPIQFIEANELGFLEGCVVKRVTRHNQPTGKGRQDIEKAIHELQLLLELRYGKAEKA